MNCWVKVFAAAVLVGAYVGFSGGTGVAGGVAQLAFFASLVGLMVSVVLASGPKDTRLRSAAVTHLKSTQAPAGSGSR